MKRLMVAVVLLSAVCFARSYHKVDLAMMAAQEPGSGRVPTHVEVVGKVTLVKREADGDRHIRLCSGASCIVAECIPSLPCDAPKLGQTVTVQGISRYDTEHKWHEVHPVEKLMIRP